MTREKWARIGREQGFIPDPRKTPEALSIAFNHAVVDVYDDGRGEGVAANEVAIAALVMIQSYVSCLPPGPFHIWRDRVVTALGNMRCQGEAPEEASPANNDYNIWLRVVGQIRTIVDATHLEPDDKELLGRFMEAVLPAFHLQINSERRHKTPAGATQGAGVMLLSNMLDVLAVNTTTGAPGELRSVSIRKTIERLHGLILENLTP